MKKTAPAQILTIPAAKLKPLEGNPRKNRDPQAHEKLTRLIKEHGFRGVLDVYQEKDGRYSILVGNHRFDVGVSLGIREFPCQVYTGSRSRALARAISDNRSNEWTEWDLPKLKDMVVAIDDGAFDLDLTGFDQAEINALFEHDIKQGLTPDDQTPEVPEIAVSKEGDIYQMDEHRLLCGDATSAEALRQLLGGAQADMVWTDPPYNVDYRGSRQKERKAIKNDNLPEHQFRNFLKAVFINVHAALKPGGCFYVSHADGGNLGNIFRQAVAETDGLLLKQCLVWVKNQFTLSRQDYNWKHEPILYGWKEGQAHYFNGDYTQCTVFDDDTQINKMTRQELLDMIKELRNAIPTSVVRENKPQISELHPTQKPVELVSKNIRASSQREEIVLDLFGGSGTTLIAAEKNSRTAYLMELEPKYCDVIVERWEAFTGRKAQRTRGTN